MEAQQTATAIVQKLVNAGHIAYFAGGWVRDFLLKHPSDDIDIATSASVEEVQTLFPKTVPVGIAFGIVIVVEEGHQFEVATFRKDRGYADGRRPTGIDPATPEEDAERRDFTINGMFYDPLRNQLYDFVRGRRDLEQGIIRAIGNPHERFLEDRLRMMRAVRYSTRFGFTIEEKTLEAIRTHASSLFPSVAMERVWQEFKKMAQFAHFDRGLTLLHELGLLQMIFPELKEIPASEISRGLQYLPSFPQKAPPVANLLELFPSSSLEKKLELCDRLKLSNDDREFVAFYHHAQELLGMSQTWQERLELVEWARFYAHPSAAICLEIFGSRLQDKESFFRNHQERRKHLHHAIERMQKKQPLVRAELLMKAGISPGKKMGALLAEAERLAVNSNDEDAASVLEKLKQSPLWRDV